MDLPPWFKTVISPAIASTLFQFMRIPITMHEKVGMRMVGNFNLANATASAATGISVLVAISQLKDIGKEKPSYDLETEEGQLRLTKMIIEYTPALGASSLVQMNGDVIGRMLSAMQGKDYEGRQSDELNTGVTFERLAKAHESLWDVVDGKANGRDVSELARIATTNFFPLNWLNNMIHDEIKDTEFQQ